VRETVTTRPANQLNFGKTSDPIPTIEIDTDSIADIDRMRTIRRTLASLANGDTETRATIYVHANVSFNFHEMTNSDFIGVVGPMSVLQSLQSEFSRVPGVRIRFSDYISTRDSVMAYHLEDGALWVPEDAVTWCSVDSPTSSCTDSAEPALPSDTGNEQELSDGFDEDFPDEGEVDLKGFRIESPARYRAARADASIGSIRRQIETVFGLPEGSVALCGPDGRPLRADAKIATLRRRWDQ
jgi:hypothetical protein